jgi:nucleoside 2-deoxyribosyltransferase
MKVIVTHASAFDFRTKLYEPLRASALSAQHDIYLPQERGKEQMTQEMIKDADVVLAEVSLPSTGQGIELGWAHVSGVPIICLHERNAKVSSSLRFITDKFVEYGDANEMLQKLQEELAKV